MALKSTERAGTLTYRCKNGHGYEFLVVSNKDRSRWVLPLGRIERGESPAEAAVRETREEAGVRVKIGRGLGILKWKSPGGDRREAVFYLAKFRFETDWDEKHFRKRRWVPLTGPLKKLAGDFKPIVSEARKALLHGRLTS